MVIMTVGDAWRVAPYTSHADLHLVLDPDPILSCPILTILREREMVGEYLMNVSGVSSALVMYASADLVVTAQHDALPLAC